MDAFVHELFVKMRTERGFQAQVVSIDHIPSLQQEMERRHRENLFDKDFYQERLGWINFGIPRGLPEARSLIVVAVPRPQTQAIFTWKGQRRPLILPPTYTAYTETRRQVEDLLAELLSKEGYRLATTALPLKLLAVQSGLGQYGRNNICYVSGMGSFLQLVAVYSDLPCEKDTWQEASMMKACEKCQLCGKACPTDAISSDRFLLHAERCIVYHNEKKGDIPFPDWMKSAWHNCIVGCMHCQRACPINRNFIEWIGEKEQFSEEETDLVLKAVPRDELPVMTLRKLEKLSLTDYFDSLPRNLTVLFK